MPLNFDPSKPRPTLNSTVVTYVEVDHNDLEQFIQEATGRSLNIVADQEWGNYSSHPVTVDGSDEDAEKYEDFLAGKRVSFALQAILNGLARDGLLLMGDYSIKVYW